MNTLVINCGSSSLKFAVYNTDNGNCHVKGLAEPIGGVKPTLTWTDESGEKHVQKLPAHADLKTALKALGKHALGTLKIDSVGHRTVHGGERFQEPTLITEQVLEEIEACNHLAPLHNPANLLGIQEAQAAFPDVPHVGVFDTAFHQSIAKEAYLYPLPYEYYEKYGIRRYGFHGTSHRYVYQQAADILGKPIEKTSIISAHLGNGCSATAASGGLSRDTTMGLTPLEGLVMGTRCGDIDPSIHGFLQKRNGMSLKEIDSVLNKKSGLLGLSGISNDMRTLREKAAEGSERARLALDIFVFRLAKSIAGLRVAIDDCDALIFTGGIGENDRATRAETINRLGFLGLTLDPVANANNGVDQKGRITTPESSVAAYVIPTNEELMIAQETASILGQ